MNALAPWLRIVAIAIAIAGVIDPAFTRLSPLKPDVALVVAGPLPDPALADRVGRAIGPVATVVRGPSIGAAAVVSVGYQLPDPPVRDTPAAFAVVPVARSPFVSIESVQAPARGSLHSRIPVTVTVRARAAQRRSLVVQLEVSGVAIDRSIQKVGRDDERVTVELGLVASAAGHVTPTITAQIDGEPAAAHADVSVRLGSDRHAVLLFDRRPSWMSTFVRRALEGDARFVVSSRIATSRNAATVAGQPPVALTGLDAFDLVVIGAPDLMTSADADGLERFMRDRGGVVVILMDAPTTNAALDRLAGTTQWVPANRAEPAGTPLASETQTPAMLPRWAEPMAFARGTPAEAVSPIWQTPIGRGRLIVSGALDAWRYRERDNAGFDRFWRLLAADAMTNAAGAADVDAPGAAPELRAPTPDEDALLRAWTSSHNGAAFVETDLASLPPALARSLSAPLETKSIHPMRSGWWIAPFAVLLGFEWWHRRRNGER